MSKGAVNLIAEIAAVETNKKIISIMKLMPDVALAELANVTGLSGACVRWNIRKLKNANLIRCVGFRQERTLGGCKSK